ncbi:hypothetical protein B0H67DRAFT_389200 [Lasiosphaeris hirsuta]|uniref:Uncharacterized protein n=1 Tax=Lasiosphaeris hirsuta TaxID=260670 RepID=A0AA39ZXZ4_9PEZI|nr:hypothetical protein B0H67DRAFT_389200 [Lasiosphaeris hirsuta]
MCCHILSLMITLYPSESSPGRHPTNPTNPVSVLPLPHVIRELLPIADAPPSRLHDSSPQHPCNRKMADGIAHDIIFRHQNRVKAMARSCLARIAAQTPNAVAHLTSSRISTNGCSNEFWSSSTLASRSSAPITVMIRKRAARFAAYKWASGGM